SNTMNDGKANSLVLRTTFLWGLHLLGGAFGYLNFQTSAILYLYLFSGRRLSNYFLFFGRHRFGFPKLHQTYAPPTLGCLAYGTADRGGLVARLSGYLRFRYVLFRRPSPMPFCPF